MSSHVWESMEAAAEITRLRAALAERDWQPIETAPKDGTWFLAYSPAGTWARVSWGRNRFDDLCWMSSTYWWLESEGLFTHWMPLPPPPQEVER